MRSPGTKAIDIATTAVERYKTMRLKDKAAPATVSRELAALKRMFRLGMRQGMVATMPYISLLTENNVRKGFFELDQFKLLLKYMPRSTTRCTRSRTSRGWRIRSELLTRQWRHVDFSRKGSLRLDPGEAKDASTGREFIMTIWLREVLERQQRWVKKVGKANGIVVPWVFCRANGKPMSKDSKAWREASKQAGIERIPHDFRRTAVRNLERAGVPRTTSMADRPQDRVDLPMVQHRRPGDAGGRSGKAGGAAADAAVHAVQGRVDEPERVRQVTL